MTGLPREPDRHAEDVLVLDEGTTAMAEALAGRLHVTPEQAVATAVREALTAARAARATV